jgi:hypothetical protein
MPPSSQSKIFITHAESDEPLARALVKLLRLGTNAGDRVFCSSIEGLGVPTGESIGEYIRDNVEKSALIILVISPAYLNSLYCHYELGAIWAYQKPTFPFILPGASYRDLPSPLGGSSIRAETITDSAALGMLRDRVNELLEIEVLNTPLWETARNEFLTDLPEILGQIAPKPDSPLATRHSMIIEAGNDYHMVFHKLRDAAFVTVLNGVADDHAEEYLGHLGEAVDHFSAAFSTLTGAPCRACIKRVKTLESEDTSVASTEEGIRPILVFDLVRSAPHKPSPQRDYVHDNTDFEVLIRRDDNKFLCNDLVGLFNEGKYKNSHWGDTVPDPVPYRSTIVWPIRKILRDPNTASKLGAYPFDQHILGFLCVDSALANVFDPDQVSANNLDFNLGAPIADTLYHVLQPWIGQFGPEADAPEDEG